MRERAPTSDEGAVTRATRRAIKAAGGVEAVASELDQSTTRVSLLQNPYKPDIVSVRQMLILDEMAMPALGGVPPILSAIARLLGCVVIPGPGTVVAEDGVQANVMEVVAEVGDVASSIRAGLADGRWTLPELREAITQTDEMDAASGRLRASLHREVQLLTEGQGA